MKRLVAFSMLAALLVSNAQAAEPRSPLAQRIEEVRNLFCANQADYSKLLDPQFLAKVPAASLTPIFKDYIGIHPEPPHLVHTLRFGLPAPALATLDEAVAKLKEFPGTTSLALYQPGVLVQAWLIKKKGGNWYALASGWNNSQAPLDELRFFELLQGVILLLEQQP